MRTAYPGEAEHDPRAGEVLRILSREGEAGEATIARELGVDAQELGNLLPRLQHNGQVTRTASGSWRLTPAAESRTEPKPHPDEPPQ